MAGPGPGQGLPGAALRAVLRGLEADYVAADDPRQAPPLGGMGTHRALMQRFRKFGSGMGT